MSDIKIAKAIVKLFRMKDIDGDGSYTLMSVRKEQETGLMSADLAVYLSKIDSEEENGFNSDDISRFIQNEGLKGFKKFYPRYDFSYNEKKDLIEINDKTFLVLSGKLDSNSGRCLKARKDIGFPQSLLKGLELYSCEPAKNKIPAIGIEERHGRPEYGRATYSIARAVLDSDRKAKIVFFKESLGDPELMDADEPFFRKQWDIYSDMLRTDWLMSADPESNDTRLNSILRYMLPTLKKIRTRLGSRLADLSYEKIVEMMKKDKSLMELFSEINPAWVLHVLYGDRITTVNIDSNGSVKLANAEYHRKKRSEMTLFQEQSDAMRRIDALDNGYSLAFRGHEDDMNTARLDPPMVKAHSDYMKAVTSRTDNWIRNIKGFKDINPEYFADGSRVIYIYSGGMEHMPRLVEALKGDFSLLHLRPEGFLK